MSLSVFGQKLTGMEHIVTYVERRLVKFIQETFTKQDNSGVDKDCRDCRTQQQTCRQQRYVKICHKNKDSQIP